MAGNWTMAMDEEILLRTNGTTLTVCLKLPPNVNSNGIWGSHSTNPSLLKTAIDSALPLLELQMLLIYAIFLFIHFFLKRLGLPVLVSQIIIVFPLTLGYLDANQAGLIIGSSTSTEGHSKVLERFKHLKEEVFFVGTQDVIAMTAVFGYILFVFLIAVRMDVSMIKKTGRKALIIGALSLLAPSGLGFVGNSLFTRFSDGKYAIDFHFLVATRSSTSLMVIACLLDHLQLLNSELGRLGLSSALVSELLGVALSTSSNLIRTSRNERYLEAFLGMATLLSFVIVIVFIIRPAMFWVVRRTPEGQEVDKLCICSIIFLVLVSGLISELLGQTMVFGPFILGLAIPEGPPLGSTLISKLDGFTSSVFLPLFVSICAIKADLGSIRQSSDMLLGMYMSIICLTFLSKVGVCLGTGFYCKMPFSDSLALGLIMSCRGIVELANYSFFYDSNVVFFFVLIFHQLTSRSHNSLGFDTLQIINDHTFAMLVLDVLFVSSAFPLAVKWLYDPSKKYAGYQKRSIISMKPNSDLRILACIHTQNDIKALTNLLDVSCPHGESPVSVYALHLIELIGRTSPVFISHQLQADFSDRPITNYLIHSLGTYKRSNQGAVSVEVFTAISPSKLMHEDICTIALDKLTQLIILPFHRKWSLDASIESEDGIIRNLNRKILERAPCSIGILIDRGHFTSLVTGEASTPPCFRVAMIFIGGSDDREALSFVKRMRNESRRIEVSVIHLVAKNHLISEWERMLDSQVMKETRAKFVGREEFRYIEKRAEEGAETTLLVQSMKNEFNLIVVGRRNGLECPQTSGLIEWSEVPEIGILGDMLASSDVGCKASVLVVQQQQLAL